MVLQKEKHLGLQKDLQKVNHLGFQKDLLMESHWVTH